MNQAPKIYFASDLHLGIPDYQSSLEREKLFIKWLEMVSQDATEIFLVGDIFDFWHDYSKAVPKGFVRLMGKIAEIADSGLPVHFFRGNHDLWLNGYLDKELGVIVHEDPIEREFAGKKFQIGHGDGLGPGDGKYKFIKGVFTNPVCRWLFKWIHPDIGITIAHYWSHQSRFAEGGEIPPYLGEEKEWLIQHCKQELQQKHFDYFVFGHRHLPLDVHLNENSRYINLGDWINYFTYAVFDGENLELKTFKGGVVAPSGIEPKRL